MQENKGRNTKRKQARAGTNGATKAKAARAALERQVGAAYYRAADGVQTIIAAGYDFNGNQMDANAITSEPMEKLAVLVFNHLLTTSTTDAQTQLDAERLYAVALASLRRNDEETRTQARRAARALAGRKPSPKDGTREQILMLARHVQHALAVPRLGLEGEAQQLARVVLPSIGTTPVETRRVSELLERWGERPSRYRITVEGIVHRLAVDCGLVPASVAPRRVNEALRAGGVTNSPKLLQREDGTMPGRSRLLAVQALSF